MARPTVVVSPDSLKGCLSAADAAEAVAAGITATCPEADVRTVPLSDGGEGLVDVLPLSGRISDAADDLYALGVHVASRVDSWKRAAV